MADDGGGKMGLLTFSMQIGLVRESVTVDVAELSLPTLKDFACAFVDRKVNTAAFSFLCHVTGYPTMYRRMEPELIFAVLI